MLFNAARFVSLHSPVDRLFLDILIFLSMNVSLGSIVLCLRYGV